MPPRRLQSVQGWSSCWMSVSYQTPIQALQSGYADADLSFKCTPSVQGTVQLTATARPINAFPSESWIAPV